MNNDAEERYGAAAYFGYAIALFGVIGMGLGWLVLGGPFSFGLGIGAMIALPILFMLMLWVVDFIISVIRLLFRNGIRLLHSAGALGVAGASTRQNVN